MTPAEYQRICDRLARKAIRFAAKLVADEDVDTDSIACPKCERHAGEPCRFPAWASESDHDAPEGFVHNERASAALDAQSEHWIDVFLDEHLPKIDPEVLLAVTAHADAFEKSVGDGFSSSYLVTTGYTYKRPAPSPAVAAFHAFQADVRDAISRTEPSASLPDTQPKTQRAIVTTAEHVAGLELRIEVKLLGYVVEHYTGQPDHARAVAKIKAHEVAAVAAELLRDCGWERTE